MAFFTIVPVASLRYEPSHKSEMVSQLLFGELCDVLETTKDFVKIKCQYDEYEGWCQKSQLTEYGVSEYKEQSGFIPAFTGEVLINGESCIIPHAAVVLSGDSPEISIGPYRLLYLDRIAHAFDIADDKAALIKEFAYRYLGVSYLWGGKSVFGIDCSGFTQQVYKMAGIKLPRDSSQQAEQGELVGFLQEAKLGDLAFFDNDEGRIIHVGIMLNDHEIIHASGNVHIDHIDTQGIVHSVTRERTHRLRMIKRMF